MLEGPREGLCVSHTQQKQLNESAKATALQDICSKPHAPPTQPHTLAWKASDYAPPNVVVQALRTDLLGTNTPASSLY